MSTGDSISNEDAESNSMHDKKHNLNNAIIWELDLKRWMKKLKKPMRVKISKKSIRELEIIFSLLDVW